MSLMYSRDLVLIADTQEECIPKLKAWMAGVESKGLHVNMKKTQVSVVGLDTLKKSVKCPCALCHIGVSNKSVKC